MVKDQQEEISEDENNSSAAFLKNLNTVYY
jgi:hypothetical protein